MPTVAIDFDGVLHRYSRGWQDGSIYDPPVTGALDALDRLRAGYAVAIFTTRNVEQVKEWLTAHGVQRIQAGDTWTAAPFWNDREHILVTNRKPAAIAYIDDRGIRFTDWDQALAELEEATR